MLPPLKQLFLLSATDSPECALALLDHLPTLQSKCDATVFKKGEYRHFGLHRELKTIDRNDASTVVIALVNPSAAVDQDSSSHSSSMP